MVDPRRRVGGTTKGHLREREPYLAPVYEFLHADSGVPSHAIGERWWLLVVPHIGPPRAATDPVLRCGPIGRFESRAKHEREKEKSAKHEREKEKSAKVKTQFMEEIYHTSNTISIFTIILHYFVVNQTMQTCGCTRYCTHCRGLKRKNKLYPLCMHHGVVRHRFPDAHRSFHVP